MVAIGVFSFVTYQTTGYTTQLVGISSRYCCRLVAVAEEARNNVLYSVSTAEGAYKSGLLCRVARLLNLMGDNVTLSAAHWPAAHVVRVHVLRQDLIDVARRPVLVLENIRRVLAGTRPVE